MFTLTIDISEKYVKLYTLIKDELRYKHIQVIDETTDITSIVGAYLKNKFITSCILIIHEPTFFRFTTLPLGLPHNKIQDTVKIYLKEYFPVDISNYTTDYKIIATEPELNILVHAIKTEKINKYLNILKPLRIPIKKVELYQNLLVNSIGDVDKSYIMCVTQLKDGVINIQVLNNGAVIQILDWNGSDVHNLMLPYTGLEKEALINKVYVSGIDEEITKQFEKYNIDIVRIDDLYETLKVKEFLSNG